jgi:plastocyanin
MTVPRAARSGLLLCVLCLLGGASAAIAASGRRSSHERSSHASNAARACHRHRAKHRHCLAVHDGKQTHHRKHKRGSLAKPSAPGDAATGTGSSGASSAPWSAAPTPLIPGSTTPGSGGTSPGSGGAAPTETPTAPAGPAHVQVTAEDTEAFRFVLSRPSVPAGEVVIEFVNHGQDEHNLNVKPGEGEVEGSLPNTAPNAHPSLSLKLHAGSYTLFCSLPHHEEKGMKATLKVE